MTLTLKKYGNTSKSRTALILMPFVGVNKIYSQDELERISGSLASDRLQIKPLIKALRNFDFDIAAASLNTTFQLNELKKSNSINITMEYA